MGNLFYWIVIWAFLDAIRYRRMKKRIKNLEEEVENLKNNIYGRH